MAIKQGLSIVNTPGLIDAHYRGELKVILINLDPTNDIQINKGDRIAQLVIQEVPTVNLIEVEELDETDRGKGGFGSSGIARALVSLPPGAYLYHSMLKHSRFASLAAKLRVERYRYPAGGYSLEIIFTFLVSRRDKGTPPLSRRLTVFILSGSPLQILLVGNLV